MNVWKENSWIKEFQGAITICDANGIILYMNDRAAQNFEKDGGKNLVGRSLIDCHSEPAKEKLKELIAGQKTNCYTIEKKGVKKIIYQSPWYEDGKYGGIIELSLEIPFDMPHFVRS